jgi:hypothetical protein
MKQKLVYVACPLGDGPDRPLNIVRASKWVAWAAEQGVIPIATWVILASQWPETEEYRQKGLALDCALVERADEMWLCGPRVSPSMHVEATHAKKVGVPLVVLIDASFLEGPPTKASTFIELALAHGVNDAVRLKLEMMAAHHGYSPGDFARLSALQVVALNHAKPFHPPPMLTAEPVPATPSPPATLPPVLACGVTIARKGNIEGFDTCTLAPGHKGRHTDGTVTWGEDPR